MAQKNLIIRVGIDASNYNKGMDKLRAKAAEAGKAVSSSLKKSSTVAPPQPGTTVSDRVGAMLQKGSSSLITDIDINNIAQARRQAEDLSAVITKLQAKGAAIPGAAGLNAQKYRQAVIAYESVSAAISDYEARLKEETLAQQNAKDAAVDHARALQEQGDSAITAGEEASSSASRLTQAARIASRTVTYLAYQGGRLVRLPFRLLGKGVSAIRQMGSAAKASTGGLSSMVRSIRNIGAISVGLKIAGAAFGRLRSIVSDYISSNAQLQAQVNGLKSGLGQALAPAINMVIGLFSQLMPYVLGVANAIGSLFGLLTGGAWNKSAAGASKTAAATGSAAKAQKELNNQLLGFDQITRLEDDSSSDASGGGGGGGGGTAIAPIEAKTPAWMERFKSSFTDLFNSDAFKAANIGGKLGMSLQTGLDWLGGEAMKFNWNGVGQKLRANWDSFWNSGAVESFGRTVGIVLGGIGDTIIGFLGPTWDEMGQAWKDHGWKGIALYVTGMGAAAINKLTSGIFTKLLSPMFQGIADYFREHGHNSLAGFFQGIADKCKNIGTYIKDKFVDPLITATKELLGIHSPSTVFAGFAEMCVEGFVQKFENLKSRITDKFTSIRDKVTETANGIKNAFQFNWQIPQIRLPHLQVDWVDAGGVLSKFLGISHIPNLSVQWFAKGGILSGAQLFGGAGNRLFGGGEAGLEAVLPLEQNTGWMDDIADRVIQRMPEQGDVNAVINLLLDGDPIIRKVVTKLRAQARASGEPAWG